MSDEVIRFQALVAQVKTMADGGLRVSLDLPENAIEAVTRLMECKTRGAVLEVAIVPIYSEKTVKDG